MKTPGLHILFEPEEAHAADIVFVHGLEGHYKETWTNAASGFWVEWLSKDFYNVRILSYDYPNSSSFWFGHSMPLAQRSKNFLESLYAENVGIHTPVIFITHSMGGLLVKLALCEAARSHNQRYEKVLENTKGVVFLATPHRGSNLAAMGSVLRKVFRASYSLDALEPLSEYLMPLNDDFGKLRVPTYSLGESKGLRFVGIVVEENSAKSELEEDVFTLVDEDHYSICKPHSKNAQTYTFTHNFLKKQFQSVLEDEGDAKRETPKSIYHAPRSANTSTNNNNANENKSEKEKEKEKEEDSGMSAGTLVALVGAYAGMAAVALGVVAAVTKLKR